MGRAAALCSLLPPGRLQSPWDFSFSADNPAFHLVVETEKRLMIAKHELEK